MTSRFIAHNKQAGQELQPPIHQSIHQCPYPVPILENAFEVVVYRRCSFEDSCTHMIIIEE